MGKGTREWNMKGEGMGSSMSLKGNRQDGISDRIMPHSAAAPRKLMDVQKRIVAHLAVYRPIPMFLSFSGFASLFFSTVQTRNRI